MATPGSPKNYIYRMGTAPNTRAAVSQKNKVYGYMVGVQGFQQIGVVSEFGHDESRGVDPIRGVGFGDQIAELVPSVTEPMTLTLNKTLLYAVNLWQTLGYKGGVEGVARSLKHHRWPFDIKQELVFSELSSQEELDGAPGDGQAAVQPTGNGFYTTDIRALFTFYEGCWMNSYSASYTSDAAIVAENGGITVTDIIDGANAGSYGEYMDTGLAPISDVGDAGKGYSLRFAGGAGVANAPAV